MKITRWLVTTACLVVAGCGDAGLEVLVLEGEEIHASLRTLEIDSVERLHVPRDLIPENPMLSSDAAFVRVISRAGSQGRYESEGVRAAMYALYEEEHEVGFYGLEALSAEDADRIESRLRETWAYNASFDRAQVHRGGNVILVIWTDGVSPEVWQALNAVVAERLGG